MWRQPAELVRGWNEVVAPLDVSLMSLRRVESDAAREASAVLSTHANYDRPQNF